MSLAPGSRLGPYEVVAQIGEGGMGVVYRARDTRLGRDVAIKVLPPAFAEDMERLRLFEREARAVGRLNHPNILGVHDTGTYEGAPYLVMELLEGETLRDKLTGRPFSPKRAVDLTLQIARCLAAAHAQNVIHRDLNPENVFITRDGRVKILDFGLAKSVQDACAAVKSEALLDAVTSLGDTCGIGIPRVMFPGGLRRGAIPGIIASLEVDVARGIAFLKNKRTWRPFQVASGEHPGMRLLPGVCLPRLDVSRRHRHNRCQKDRYTRRLQHKLWHCTLLL